MTHAAYLCARLNEKTVRFDTGRGGLPTLTPQDVAAGIAMVPAGLGRELLCAVWWPAGAALTAGELDTLMIEAQLGEFRERMDKMVTAQIREHVARRGPGRHEAVMNLERARAQMWPHIDDTYRLIRRAVLLELREPRNCPDCSGTGYVVVKGGRNACERCAGGGKTMRGPVWRAEQLDMTHQSFRARWQAPYLWLLDHCVGELLAAERKLSRVMEA